MADVGLKDLLRAGVHFGHQTSRWNPKMRKYIFAERSGIYLLDLKKTLRQLERAREEIRDTVEQGKRVLFVCTKPQLAEIVRNEAERCGAFHVTERWVGGLLTNFQTIKKNIRRLKELETGLEEGHFDYYTKKEQILLDRERQKLDRYLSGIKQMTSLPGLVFVVDAKREEIAVKEADRLDIPVVAIADTNADPDRLDVPIPGNDDAIRAVELITRAIADAVEAAKREVPESKIEEEAEAYTYSSDVGETADTGGEEPSRRRKRPRRRPKPEVIARARKDQEGEPGPPEAPEPEEVRVEPATEGPARAEAEKPAGAAGTDEEVPEEDVARAEAEAAEAADVEPADLEEARDEEGDADEPEAAAESPAEEDEEPEEEGEAVAVSSAAGEAEEEKREDTESS
jgi:small subunit ribosomal protein S2